MGDKFNPAPIDKHAANPKEAAKADRATHNELLKGLKDSFPASLDCLSTRGMFVSFGASSTFGARAGGWISPWFGLALDVSSVRASGGDLNTGAIPISPLLMFRWPEAASEMRVQSIHATSGAVTAGQ